MDNNSSNLKKASPPLTRPALSWWIYGLLMMAMIVFTAVTGYGVYKMRQEAEAADVSSQGAVWLVVSFEREYLKLGRLLWRYAAEDPGLNSNDLLDQYEIFWSRIDVMQQGEHAHPLQQVDSYQTAVPTTLKLLQDHEAHFFEAIPARLPLSKKFLDSYFALERPIHDYMVDVHIDRTWAIDQRDSQVKDTRLAIYATMAGTLVSTLLLFTIIIIQLAGRQRYLNQALRALAQSEIDRNALLATEEERSQLTNDLKARNEELERYAYTIPCRCPRF